MLIKDENNSNPVWPLTNVVNAVTACWLKVNGDFVFAVKRDGKKITITAPFFHKHKCSVQFLNKVKGNKLILTGFVAHERL